MQWRHLLVPDLVLGSVVSGQLVGPDGQVGGRVRGQVIALGVQTGLGRPFDAAVIELFGADRCMFASNFPVDSLCASFTTIFDGFRAIVADLPPEDQRALFRDNALRIYAIP